MKKLISNKNLFALTFVSIIILGIFLRFFHIHDWMHYELDQARDAKVVYGAIEKGPGELPLLGPRAAGTFLRLGPAFYYMEYLSALMFSNNPSGMTVIIAILSILSLPLFYLFVNKYFNKKISLGLLLLFSVSVFLVIYARFPWNPNPIPFFALLLFYSLLRLVSNKEKNKYLWLYVAAFAIAIGTQLHFLALVSFSLISAIFLLIKRPKIKVKHWIVAVVILMFFYSPVIINDIKAEGANAEQFIEAISGKSEDQKHNIVEKGIRNFTEHSLGYFLILSGQEQAEHIKVDFGYVERDIRCDQGCRNNLHWGILGSLLLIIGILLLVKNLFQEKIKKRKDFLLLTTLWFFIPFLLFLPISYDLSPRFYLITAPIPLVFFGFLLEFLLKTIHKRRRAKAIVLVLILIFAGSNLLAVKERFYQKANAPYKAIDIDPDRILKERARITLEQQKMIVDYIQKHQKENGYPVYIESDAQYIRPLKYLTETRGMIAEEVSVNSIFKEGNYFLVYRTHSDLEDKTAKYLEVYDLVKVKDFGTLTLYHLTPKPEEITEIREPFKDLKDKDDLKKRDHHKDAPRYVWIEIFNWIKN